jgi:excisionase family DNA binding protein
MVAQYKAPELEKPLTKQELADLLGYSTRYLDQEVKKGNLRKINKGKGSRFFPSDVKRWLDSKANVAPKEVK